MAFLFDQTKIYIDFLYPCSIFSEKHMRKQSLTILGALLGMLDLRELHSKSSFKLACMNENNKHSARTYILSN